MCLCRSLEKAGVLKLIGAEMGGSFIYALIGLAKSSAGSRFCFSYAFVFRVFNHWAGVLFG